MLLPNANRAIISLEKITDYVLNFDHFEGKNKARMFASLLELTKENADDLIKLIKEAILKAEAIKQSESEYGTKYIVDFNLSFKDKTALIRTAWIVDANDDIPRLITCYVKL